MFQDIGLRLVIMGAGEFRRNISSAQAQVRGLASDIERASSSSLTMTQKLDAVGSAFMRTGQLLTTHLTIPLAILGGSLIGAGIQFEDAFAGVSKTVDGVSDDFGNLTQAGVEIREQFRQMALEIPLSVNEFARIGELGGQLGITKTELKDFVETVALLGVTTEMTSEDAATFFARLGNIMGVASSDMAEFTKQAGTTVVDLGNKFAATEPEIATLSLRLAGAGQAAGLSTPQILAMATAMASMGIQAEMGGSAVSRILLETKRAVDDFNATGGTATDQLKLFAQAAGLTVQEFVAMQKADPNEVFLKLVGGFNRMSVAGEISNDVLKTMNLDTIRLQDVLNRLGPNIELVRQAMAVSNAEWKDGNALQIEAQKRFNTTKSQLILLKNAFVDLGIELFLDFKEPINALIKSLREFITSISLMDEGVLRMVVKFALLAAVLGPVLSLIGSLITFIGGAGAIFGALTNPVGLAILGVVAFATAWKTNFLGIQDTTKKVVEAVKNVAYWVGKAFSFGTNLKGNVFGGVASAFKSLTYVYKDHKTTFFSNVLQAFGLGEKLSQSLGMVIRNVLTPPLLVLNYVFNILADVVNVVMGTVQRLYNSFLYVTDGAKLFTEAFRAFQNGNFGEAWRLLKLAVEEFANWFTTYGLSIIRQGLQALLPIFQQVLVDVGTWIIENVPQIVATLAQWAKSFVDWVITTAPEVLEALGDLLEGMLSWIGDAVADIAPKLADWALEFVDWVTDAISDLIPKLGDLLSALLKWVEDKVVDIVEQLLVWGAAFIDWLGPVIQDILPKLGEYLGTIISWLLFDALPKLVAELVKLAAEFIAWVPKAIIDIAPELGNFLKSVVDFILYDLIPGIATAVWEFGKAFLDGMKKGIEENWESFKNSVTDLFDIDLLGGIKDRLGIDSPSKAFAEIGKNMVEGMVMGLKSQKGLLDQTNKAIFGNLGGDVNSTIQAALTSPFANGTTQYNNTTNTNRTSVFSPTINGAVIGSEERAGEEIARVYRMAQMGASA